MAMITALDISLSFNGTLLFNNLSFDIAKGENVCFSGPSGKGKSTLLKMLQGYVLPDSGTLSIAGKELNAGNIKQIRPLMAYIPQNVNLPVNNGTELFKLTCGINPDKKVDHFIEQLGMPAEMLGRSFDEMSGGQKQRVVIAICLSLQRRIIIMDEPTSSLDDESVGRLVQVVKSLENTTFISASHNYKWIRSAGKVIAL